MDVYFQVKDDATYLDGYKQHYARTYIKTCPVCKETFDTYPAGASWCYKTTSGGKTIFCCSYNHLNMFDRVNANRRNSYKITGVHPKKKGK